MKILYCDRDIIVCIKPSGAVSTDEPGGMPELIRKEIGAEKEVRTVHRLDSVVSGLMVYALSKEAASGLSGQITDGTFIKEYMAVVEGVPKEKEARLHDYLRRDNKARKTYVLSGPAHDAQEAVLTYTCLEKNEGVTLVRVKLITGRTHQIRAQFSSRGLPLYGDRKYSSRNRDARIALWSCHLRFLHPVTAERMDFSAMPPARIPWTIFNSQYHADYDAGDVELVFKRPASFSDCRYAGSCDGCAYQGMDYAKQLEKKRKLVSKWLKKGVSIETVVAANQQLAYKHKTISVFDVDKSGRLRFGTYLRSSKPLQISHCALNHGKSDEICETLRGLMEKYHIPAYDRKKGSGWLRYAVIRVSATTGEALLTIVAVDNDFKSKHALLRELLSIHPEIKTVILNVNGKNTPSVMGKEESIIYGSGYIEEALMGFRYRLGTRSGFPVNPAQADKLYRTALEYAALTGSERVLEIGCGLMTVAASTAKRVIGVTASEELLRETRSNLALNEIANVKTVQSEPVEYLTALARSHEHFNVLFADSTRSRISSALLKQIGALAPDRIVYISGNPEKCSQDLAILCEYGYVAERVSVFDTMPYTAYVETVVLLSGKRSKN